MSLTLAQRFAALFAGNTERYGRHIPEQSGVAGKQKGQSFTEEKPVTQELYDQHIYGKASIGVVPITKDSTVFFAAIDVDVYPLKPKTYVDFFNTHSVPMTCFRSKSGGVHAYVFFSKAEEAEQVVPLVQKIRSIVGLPSNTEVFPKQTKLTGKGNWINLPYQNAEQTERYAYGIDCEPLRFEDAVILCESKRTSVKELKAAIDRLPFAPAPPCLQTMFLLREVTEANHNRNVFMFNVACYLKARFGDGFEEPTHRVNDQLPTPLSDSEMTATVIPAHRTGSYSYQCDNDILRPYCNKVECLTREFGKGSQNLSDFNFEQLTQVLTSTPYYKWVINGHEMEFYSESELRNQGVFMDYAIRHLHKCPNRIKADQWTAVLNRALEGVKIETPAEGEDVSEESLFQSHFKEFLTYRAFAATPSHVKGGQVYYDTERGYYFFRVEDLIYYLEAVKRVRLVHVTRIHRRLKAIGADASKVYDPNLKRSFRAWRIAEEYVRGGKPTEALPKSEIKSKGTNLSRDVSADELIARISELDSEDF